MASCVKWGGDHCGLGMKSVFDEGRLSDGVSHKLNTWLTYEPPVWECDSAPVGGSDAGTEEEVWSKSTACIQQEKSMGQKCSMHPASEVGGVEQKYRSSQ